MQGETREEVWKALDSLPETSRLTTILYYIDGYTTRDISSFLGVSVKAVENRLRRARQKLKREMISVIEGNLKQHGDEFERKIEGLLSEVKKLQAVGKQKEALEAIRKAVDMKPDDMSLRRILANVLFTLGSVEQDKVILSEAEAEFRKVLAHDPGAYLGLGYIYLWRGETDKAIEHFQKLLRQPSLEWKIALAQAINEKGEREEYIRLFQEAAAESLGLLLFSLSELARAMRAAKDKRMEYRYCETFVRVVEATGRDGSTLFMGWNGYLDLAELQLEDGNISEALTSIRHARDIARLATGEVSSSLLNKVPMEAVRSFQCTEIELFLEYLNQKRFDALRGNPEFERLIVETKTEVETERDKAGQLQACSSELTHLCVE